MAGWLQAEDCGLQAADAPAQRSHMLRLHGDGGARPGMGAGRAGVDHKQLLRAWKRGRVFGQGSGLKRSGAQGRVATLQSLSGTGSLRVGAEFISKFLPGTTVYLSSPTWRAPLPGAGSASPEACRRGCALPAATLRALRWEPGPSALLGKGMGSCFSAPGYREAKLKGACLVVYATPLALITCSSSDIKRRAPRGEHRRCRDEKEQGRARA